jgi:hypothetical protein
MGVSVLRFEIDNFLSMLALMKLTSEPLNYE